MEENQKTTVSVNTEQQPFETMNGEKDLCITADHIVNGSVLIHFK